MDRFCKNASPRRNPPICALCNCERDSLLNKLKSYLRKLSSKADTGCKAQKCQGKMPTLNIEHKIITDDQLPIDSKDNHWDKKQCSCPVNNSCYNQSPTCLKNVCKSNIQTNDCRCCVYQCSQSTSHCQCCDSSPRCSNNSNIMPCHSRANLDHCYIFKCCTQKNDCCNTQCLSSHNCNNRLTHNHLRNVLLKNNNSHCSNNNQNENICCPVKHVCDCSNRKVEQTCCRSNVCSNICQSNNLNSCNCGSTIIETNLGSSAVDVDEESVTEEPAAKKKRMYADEDYTLEKSDIKCEAIGGISEEDSNAVNQEYECFCDDDNTKLGDVALPSVVKLPDKKSKETNLREYECCCETNHENQYNLEQDVDRKKDKFKHEKGTYKIQRKNDALQFAGTNPTEDKNNENHPLKRKHYDTLEGYPLTNDCSNNQYLSLQKHNNLWTLEQLPEVVFEKPDVSHWHTENHNENTRRPKENVCDYSKTKTVDDGTERVREEYQCNCKIHSDDRETKLKPNEESFEKSEVEKGTALEIFPIVLKNETWKAINTSKGQKYSQIIEKKLKNANIVKECEVNIVTEKFKERTPSDSNSVDCECFCKRNSMISLHDDIRYDRKNESNEMKNEYYQKNFPGPAEYKCFCKMGKREKRKSDFKCFCKYGSGLTNESSKGDSSIETSCYPLLPKFPEPSFLPLNSKLSSTDPLYSILENSFDFSDPLQTFMFGSKMFDINSNQASNPVSKLLYIMPETIKPDKPRPKYKNEESVKHDTRKKRPPFETQTTYSLAYQSYWEEDKSLMYFCNIPSQMNSTHQLRKVGLTKKPLPPLLDTWERCFPCISEEDDDVSEEFSETFDQTDTAHASQPFSNEFKNYRTSIFDLPSDEKFTQRNNANHPKFHSENEYSTIENDETTEKTNVFEEVSQGYTDSQNNPLTYSTVMELRYLISESRQTILNPTLHPISSNKMDGISKEGNTDPQPKISDFTTRVTKRFSIERNVAPNRPKTIQQPPVEVIFEKQLPRNVIYEQTSPGRVVPEQQPIKLYNEGASVNHNGQFTFLPSEPKKENIWQVKDCPQARRTTNLKYLFSSNTKRVIPPSEYDYRRRKSNLFPPSASLPGDKQFKDPKNSYLNNESVFGNPWLRRSSSWENCCSVQKGNSYALAEYNPYRGLAPKKLRRGFTLC